MNKPLQENVVPRDHSRAQIRLNGFSRLAVVKTSAVGHEVPALQQRGDSLFKRPVAPAP
jgi:hypothetical protein